MSIEAGAAYSRLVELIGYADIPAALAYAVRRQVEVLRATASAATDVTRGHLPPIQSDRMVWLNEAGPDRPNNVTPGPPPEVDELIEITRTSCAAGRISVWYARKPARPSVTDPDCRAGKHETRDADGNRTGGCTGGPCECGCHQVAIGPLVALASAWEDQAARRHADGIGPAEGTALDELAACARMLREAIAHGGQG